MNIKDTTLFLDYLEKNPNSIPMIARLTEVHAQMEAELAAINGSLSAQPGDSPKGFPTQVEQEIWQRLQALKEKYSKTKF